MVFALIIALFLLIYWVYWVFRLINPFKFILYIGKKGSGKSSFATKMLMKQPQCIVYDPTRPILKRFKIQKLKVYTNFTINTNIPYERYNPLDLGVTFFPDPYSVCYCDEISLYWWNRQFKSMNPKTIEWFRNQRKYRVKFIGFSQSFDIDRCLRQSLCDRMYLVKSFAVTWSVIRLIDKQQTIKESALDCDSQLVDSLKFASLLQPGAIKLIWLPKYIKYFDTLEIFSKS